MLLSTQSLLCFRFRSVMVKEMIHLVMTEKLSGKTYDPESTTEWTKSISDTIKNKLQGLWKIHYCHAVILCMIAAYIYVWSDFELGVYVLATLYIIYVYLICFRIRCLCVENLDNN